MILVIEEINFVGGGVGDIKKCMDSIIFN